MSIISSTIYLGQIQTAIMGTSNHYFLAKNTWSKIHLKQHFQIWGCNLFLFQCNYISPLIWMLGVNIFIDEITMCFEGVTIWTKKWWHKNKEVMDYRNMISFRNNTYNKYLCAMILCQKHIYLKWCWSSC